MTDPATNNIVLTHLGSALAVVGLIEQLKKFKWVQQAQTLICRTISVLGAFAVHIGITMTWTPAANGGWDFGGHVPAISVMVLAAYHIVLQFLYQEGFYTGLQGIQALQTIAKPKG